MNNIVCYNSDGNFLDHFTQWDVGQSIVIKGLPITNAPAVHYWNKFNKRALVVASRIENDSVIAAVPNKLLQYGAPIIVYFYYQQDEDSAKTLHSLTINVIPRAKPEDYEYVENIEYTSWIELTKEANELISEWKQATEEATERANAAAQEATDATQNANTAANAAIEATQNAITAKNEADTATSSATSAASAANTAAQEATSAAEGANSASENAVLAASRANAASDVADEALETAQTVDQKVDTLREEIPDWAMNENKPSYTASEVGAYSSKDGEALEESINNVDQKVDTLKEVVKSFHSNIVDEASGEVIALSDASDVELAGLKVFGKTEQFTTTGKNLLDFGTATASRSDVSLEITGNAIRVYSNASTGTYHGVNFGNMTLTAGTTYTVSLNMDAYVSGTVRFGFRYVSNSTFVSGASKIGLTAAGAYSFTFTPSKDMEVYLSVLVTWNTEGETGDATFSAFQMEKGTSATAWEPYTGGIPAPNPEYPQELKSVGNYGALSVYITSKNLVDVHTEPMYYNEKGNVAAAGNHHIINADGSVTVNASNKNTNGIGFIRSLAAGIPVTVSFDVTEIKSGTSIGANVREAQRSSSRKDFISKMNIALKEAYETEYWIELLHKTDYISDKEYSSLFPECRELTSILSQIILTTKKSDEIK